MTLTAQKENLSKNFKNIKNRACEGTEYVKGITVRNNSNIDLEIVSNKDSKPLFSFKKKFNKEISLISVILAILGVVLTVALVLTMLKRKKRKDNPCDCDCIDDFDLDTTEEENE